MLVPLAYRYWYFASVWVPGSLGGSHTSRADTSPLISTPVSVISATRDGALPCSLLVVSGAV